MKPSKDLAYWIGVVQSDGCFKKYLEKRRQIFRYIISLLAAKISLPCYINFKKLQIFCLVEMLVFSKNRKEIYGGIIYV